MVLSPQVRAFREFTVAGRSKSGLHLRWTTVSYSSVATALLLLAFAVGFVFYMLAPNTFHAGTNAVGSLVNRGIAKIAGNAQDTQSASGPQQAKITNVDGVVKVKRADGNTWVTANIGMLLERGDVVQTSSEGLAKVVFTDGTNYTVKPDSLIVIEENIANASSQTQVKVQLTTGTVDLYTGTYAQGSKSQVSVSGATASLAPESAAMVRNDPRADEHEILAKKGAVEVVRGREAQRLTEYDKVSFKSNSPTMTKTKEISPPTLITPANMAPIFAKGPAAVEFSWTQVEAAVAYRIQVSRNPFFTSTVFDRRVEQTALKVPNMAQGAYYWRLQSIDINGKQSVESERNRFTVVPRGTEAVSVLLEIESLVQHGRLIEVKGRTEPNAKVIINNQEVSDVRPDGSFTFFTMQFPVGENVITVTAQNARGGVNTKQQTVVIQ